MITKEFRQRSYKQSQDKLSRKKPHKESQLLQLKDPHNPIKYHKNRFIKILSYIPK